MSATAHPVKELLALLGRPAVLELLWTLRDGPVAAGDAERAELLEELRRNAIVTPDPGDPPLWTLTPDGLALTEQLHTLASRAYARGLL